ncbi:nuclear transport factor 2 family protein [Aquimarina litoralis]|uniref:nuclear transport factor 2 family protein n=1 Tax=Aquimarina litoralis TaxID=584605 RepID=UPI001C5A4B81|nr:nuclear transport factor 2 family protein [Aquimarina litoralis]
MAQQPTMKVWTDAWQEANPKTFKNVYAKNAVIFPPNKPAVQTNRNILDFMRGGLGKVDVIFERDSLIINEKLAFEYGTFKDVELKTVKILGKGKYSVTWILENEQWKVLCHTWSMPYKN